MDYIIVSTSKCAYQAWQVRLLYWSMKKTHQKGTLVLLLSDDKQYNPEKDNFDLGPDVIVIDLPNWAQEWEKKHNDPWGGIPNKYESFNWVAAHYPFKDDDVLLFLDPDMIFREAVDYQPAEDEIIGQEWRHYGSLPGWERFSQYKKAFMYPFTLRYSTLKKISKDFKEFCFQVRKQVGKWESDMWGLDYAAKNNGIHTQYIEDFGFCTVWLKDGEQSLSPLIHFPNKVEDVNKNTLFFKQEYTFKPDQKIEIHKARNKTDQALLINIDQERTDFLYHLKWDFRDIFKHYDGSKGYFFLKPYPGGFNNIRMSLELGFCLAYLSNRVLVLPTAYRMYLLEGKSDFSTFFDLSHPGIKVLNMPEFCDLKGLEHSEEAIKEVSKVVDDAAAGIVINFEKIPVPDNFHKGRKVINSEEWFDDSEIIYSDRNLLGSFDQIIYTSYETELKKFVAKHIVYRSDIFDLAWRFINYIGDRTYYAMHVRRNDFQYKNLFVPCEEILEHLVDLVPKGSRLYIATDHKDKDFFNPIKEQYEVYFYDDIASKLDLETFDVNWIPIIEQFLCTRSIRFLGMQLSTLSSYIFKMRGFMDDIEDKGFYHNALPFNEAAQCTFRADKKFAGSAWVREYKSVWDFDLQTILVSIASYADSQLIPTIEDLLANASNPSRIILGVHIQDTPENYQELLDRKYPNLRVIFTPKEKSLGVVWARNKIKNELYQGEDYFLQIDSHTRFKRNWDNILINQFNSIEEEKVVMTTYPNAFDISDEEKAYLKLDRFSPLRIRKFLTDNPKDNRLRAENLPTLKDYEIAKTKWCAAGFLFTTGDWVKDVQLPDNIKFNGEEDLMTFISFLKGYKLRVPSEATVWHCYSNKNKETGETFKESNDNTINDESIALLNDLLFGRFYLKSIKNLESFLQVKFRNMDKQFSPLPEIVQRATAWRILAKKTSSKFAWDIIRLRFLFQEGENIGKVISSGYVMQEEHDGYSAESAFSDKPRFWGGRADEEGKLWIGMNLDQPQILERIIIKQGEDHWTEDLFIQVKEANGDWQTIREENELLPGLNEVVLFDAAQYQDHPSQEIQPLKLEKRLDPVVGIPENTTKRRIRFLSAQPDTPFFVWQTHLYLENFKTLGIPMRDCIALFGTKVGAPVSPELRQLAVKYPVADIRLYNDRRNKEGKDYPASIQPSLIARAFRDNPEWKDDLIMYHDSDIVFTALPDLQSLISRNPDSCFLSDTDVYIGYTYLHKCCEEIRKEKPEIPEDELILKMCAIVGIDIKIVKMKKGGGGQYLLQGIDGTYWEKVYKDSLKIRKLFKEYFTQRGLKKKPDDYIQIWTAGMWAYLWNLWLLDLDTQIPAALDFHFASQVKEEKVNILHMAGLQNEVKHNHYDKQDWRKINPIEAVKKQAYLFDHYPMDSVARAYADWIHHAAQIDGPGLKPMQAAQKWRFLVWKTEHEENHWHIQQLWLKFGGGARIQQISGTADPSKNQLELKDWEDPTQVWRGIPSNIDGEVPAVFLEVVLTEAAIPEEVEIIQSADFAAQIVVIQYQNPEGKWVSTSVANLAPSNKRQHVFYSSQIAFRAKEWRVLALDTGQKFAWDVNRVKFMYDSREITGKAISSGFIYPERADEYGDINAFNDTIRFWGGRPNQEGLFWVGLAFEQETAINRVQINQRGDHYMHSIQIQAKDSDGNWKTLHTETEIQAGMSDLLLKAEHNLKEEALKI